MELHVEGFINNSARVAFRHCLGPVCLAYLTIYLPYPLRSIESSKAKPVEWDVPPLIAPSPQSAISPAVIIHHRHVTARFQCECERRRGLDGAHASKHKHEPQYLLG